MVLHVTSCFKKGWRQKEQSLGYWWPSIRDLSVRMGLCWRGCSTCSEISPAYVYTWRLYVVRCIGITVRNLGVIPDSSLSCHPLIFIHFQILIHLEKNIPHESRFLHRSQPDIPLLQVGSWSTTGPLLRWIGCLSCLPFLVHFLLCHKEI